MKLCFLDVDGVLNNQQQLLNAKNKDTQNLCEQSLKVVKDMYDLGLFDTLIVHSSWRNNNVYNFENKSWDILSKSMKLLCDSLDVEVNGITTPKISKGASIKEFLDEHDEEIDHFFILEDEFFRSGDFSTELNPFVVKTSSVDGINIKAGLNQEHIPKAIETIIKCVKRKQQNEFKKANNKSLTNNIIYTIYPSDVTPKGYSLYLRYPEKFNFDEIYSDIIEYGYSCVEVEEHTVIVEMTVFMTSLSEDMFNHLIAEIGESKEDDRGCVLGSVPMTNHID